MIGRRSARAAGHDRDVGSFDRRAQSYERDWRSPFHVPVVAAAAEVALAALPDPAAVLDVGCGTGALLRTLAGRLPAGVELAGVDPAPAMLEVGRAALGAHERVRLARAVAEHLPFRDASFDLVVSTVSFDHWTDQPAGLAEAARVLRAAGAGRPVRDRLAAPDHRPGAAAGPRPHHRRDGGHARRRTAGTARVAACVRPRSPPAGPGRGRRARLAGPWRCGQRASAINPSRLASPSRSSTSSSATTTRIPDPDGGAWSVVMGWIIDQPGCWGRAGPRSGRVAYAPPASWWT